ncbi:UvrD-helicase domain-containing protein [Eubacterium barkeri]|uniref:DNA helicase-2 / ATP-dependent DNA helicase PcrA n=1 Tax=Eubacterium barkeri TaxID=1528 RepID=A0A1H3CXF3_EUBBA|nr:UvrD-helicase domain-containing protein [Eubacterium barkeri]SDX58903.1 DNA helicase-2 / ATP-dependent DNA helicase PcrA [Eubacterium barkeri]
MADVKKINNMFLVNAPAGSGKTTYIENSIVNLLAQYPNRRILSITYTNRAKDELNTRIDSKNVTIDTIHSFLSKFVGLYLSKPEVIDLYIQVFENKIKSQIDNGEKDSKNVRYIDKFGKLDFETIKNNVHKIFYNEQAYSSYYYGGLSHDDILFFCRKMFEKFAMLKKRLSNKYAYIFIDEYQDTSADVLYIFYQSVLNTSSNLYLLGDKMQEIYNNYDGSFNSILSEFNQNEDLSINYRCSSNIVGILNNLYNDEKFYQQPNNSCGKVNPTVMITNVFSESFVEQFKDYMQLYLFNRERFEKIGAGDLFRALSDMKAYKFPSQYTPVDALTDTTNDNPDKLFRILFCICDFIKMVSMAAYGKSIQFAREKKQIFNSEFTNIEFHNDKIIFSDKVQWLEEIYESSTMTIQEFCEFLIDNEYCNKDVFRPLLEAIEYEEVLKVSLSQLHALYAYLGAPSVSTQHGVKGEGHNNVCFIAEDSTRNPIVYMYEFFRLLCVEDVNLTDFQNFYYDYVSEIKSIDLTHLKPAKTYSVHEGEYLKYAQYIKNRYKDNKYFSFCQQKYYDKYLSNPNSTNAKECFKSTKIRGTLWAYKLFYVGCSRAKENLVIVIDENKIASFRDEFIERMKAIGFDVIITVR